MRIGDHTSGCVAHMAVLAGKLWFLGKSRSNPLCIGEWAGCGCCLALLNVEFREQSNRHSRENTSRSRVSYIGDTFRTPVSPKPAFSRNTHPCGWQGSSSPSNFPLPTCSRKSTFVQARPNLPPAPSPMHNGFDLNFPRNRSFPARTATWATFPLMWSTKPTRSPAPESRHSREDTRRSRVPLYRRFQQEIIISRHFSYPRSS